MSVLPPQQGRPLVMRISLPPHLPVDPVFLTDIKVEDKPKEELKKKKVRTRKRPTRLPVDPVLLTDIKVEDDDKPKEEQKKKVHTRKRRVKKQNGIGEATNSAASAQGQITAPSEPQQPVSGTSGEGDGPAAGSESLAINATEQNSESKVKKRFVCKDCGKTYGHNSSLKSHMRTHTGEKPFVCPDCGMAYCHLSHLNYHVLSHTGERPHVCPDCGKGFSQASSLKTHMMKHTGEKPHVCVVCNKKFTQLSGLKTHMMTHTGEKPHVCSECGKAFIQLGGLKTHMLTHSGEKPFMCQDCGKGFSQSFELKAHILSHTGEKPHMCSECGDSYRSITGLKYHMKTHTGEKPHVCAECGKGFSVAYSLKSHMLTHSVTKLHLCSDCGKAFRHTSGLTYHMKTHTGEKPHVCRHCGKAFSVSGSLKSHLLTHAGVKPHLCSECGKGFVHLSGLNYHMKTHTGEKPHVCFDCGKAFGAPSGLKTHMLTHTGLKPYVCPTCGTSFRMSSGLKKHMETHQTKTNLTDSDTGVSELDNLDTCTPPEQSDDKPHVCSYCSQAFSQADHLRNHLGTHTAEKPHVCSHCYMGFTHLATLDAHMRTHARENKPHTSSVPTDFEMFTPSNNFPMTASLTKHMDTHQPDTNPTDSDEDVSDLDNLHTSMPNEQSDNNIKTHVCSYCSKAFSHADHLRNHIETHTAKKPHVCSNCHMEFTNLATLEAHMQTHTRENKSHTSSVPRDFEISAPRNSFPLTASLKEQMESHQPNANPSDSGEGVSDLDHLHTSMPIKQSDNKMKTHVCSYCSKAFSQADQLRNHIETHTAEKPHVCSHCYMGFTHLATLETHMRTHTRENKPHTSPVPTDYDISAQRNNFPLTASLEKDMEEHQLNAHPTDSGECVSDLDNLHTSRPIQRSDNKIKTHVCSYCSMEFSQADHLKNHIGTHTAERPHVCSYCYMGFKYLATLDAHMLIHTERNKPHTSSVPTDFDISHSVQSKSFTLTASLKKHMEAHQPQANPMDSSRDVSELDNLHTSMPTMRSDKKPHVCSYCSMAFSQADHLRNHIGTHTAERPHVCSRCYMGFKYLATLDAHMLIHTVRNKPHTSSVPADFEISAQRNSFPSTPSASDILDDIKTEYCSITDKIHTPDSDSSVRAIDLGQMKARLIPQMEEDHEMYSDSNGEGFSEHNDLNTDQPLYPAPHQNYQHYHSP